MTCGHDEPACSLADRLAGGWRIVTVSPRRRDQTKRRMLPLTFGSVACEKLTSEKFSGRSDFVSSSLWRGYPCVRTEHCIIVGFPERLEEWFLDRIACTFRKIMEVRSPMYPFGWFQCVGLFGQTRVNFPSQHCGAPPVRRHTTRVPSSSYTGNQPYLTSFGNTQLERWSCQ